jgi:spore coat polysaccharide biosynthesis predicted glycosyltransferase SpsG
VTHAVLAYDGEPADGLGHRRRMEALAEALRALACDVDLVVTGESLRAELVVVDSYRFRADDKEWIDADAVVALDDLCRDLEVDIVVDPSPGATVDAHRAAKRVLTGPKYALIDPSLAEVVARPIGPDIGVVLVATGGADAGGVGTSLAASLASLLPDAEIRLALGPGVAATDDERVRVVRTERGLGSFLADADLVVTAAGVTLLEALALGRPVVAVVLADNQRQAADGAAAAGAAVVATLDDAAPAAAALASNLEQRARMAEAARQLVDGLGARRVAEAVAALSAP